MAAREGGVTTATTEPQVLVPAVLLTVAEVLGATPCLICRAIMRPCEHETARLRRRVAAAFEMNAVGT